MSDGSNLADKIVEREGNRQTKFNGAWSAPPSR
jgi:hypothetical protein